MRASLGQTPVTLPYLIYKPKRGVLVHVVRLTNPTKNEVIIYRGVGRIRGCRGSIHEGTRYEICQSK